MKILEDFNPVVEQGLVEQQLASIRETVPPASDKELLKKIFTLIDLTTLRDEDNILTINQLCEKVNMLSEAYPSLPAFASICVFPELVGVVKEKLENALISIGSVGGGFPSAQTFTNIKVMEIEQAIELGAEEIDMVLPLGKFLMEDYEYVVYEIEMIKERIGQIPLKVILGTGILQDFTLIRKAALLAIEAGADFIKTSTGKNGRGATPEAMVVMCDTVLDYYKKTGKRIGVKAAGGVSSVDDALLYYSIVSEILGKEWLNTDGFRIGASSLADGVMAEIFDKGPDFGYF